MCREGFAAPSLETRYITIKTTMKTTMAPYCQMTKYAQDYMKKLFTTKVSTASGWVLARGTRWRR